MSAAGRLRAVRARSRAVVQRVRAARLKRRLAGPKILRAFAARYPQAAFVEIGSNDGEQHDHLRPFILELAWRGVMVEPVPYVFERLADNYRHLPRIALENAAVGAQDGVAPFYHLVDASEDERRGLPSWYDGIGSFSRATVAGHVRDIATVEERIVCSPVPTLTFETLCAKHRLDRVDLLLIDTEGHDWEIIRHIDFDLRRPRLLVYEHYHLAPSDRRACRDLLVGLGYRLLEEGFDTFCLDPQPDELTATWASLRPAVAGVSVHEGPA